MSTCSSASARSDLFCAKGQSFPGLSDCYHGQAEYHGRGSYHGRDNNMAMIESKLSTKSCSRREGAVSEASSLKWPTLVALMSNRTALVGPGTSPGRCPRARSH